MNSVVLSLHGIRTRGVWQKDLVPILARNGFIPCPLDYGNFSVAKFLLPWERTKKVEWLREQIDCIPEMQQGIRSSIIAHSFGTYLVARLLEKYPMLRFDKVIFAGSIVNEDYNWPEILGRGQVSLFRNDYGRLDPWPRIAKMLVPRTGGSGTGGFQKSHSLMVQKPFSHYRHSDYFHQSHFALEWIPTLKSLVLNTDMVVAPQTQTRLTETMSLAVQMVGQSLSLDPSILRANIFTEDESGRLSIPQGLHHNMDNQTELTISIPIGVGCTGTAYKQRLPVIAVFDKNWGQLTLPDPELAKVDRRLQWIISMPIPDPMDRQRLLGIFNVDCLYVTKDRDELAGLLEVLRTWAQALGVLLRGTGYGGER